MRFGVRVNLVELDAVRAEAVFVTHAAFEAFEQVCFLLGAEGLAQREDCEKTFAAQG